MNLPESSALRDPAASDRCGFLHGQRGIAWVMMAAICLSLPLAKAGAAGDPGERSGGRPDGPVFPPQVGMEAVEGLKLRVEPVMNLSEAEMLALIPDRSGIYFVGCPNCSGGTQEGQIAWTIERPNEVFCKFCAMRFPNEKFPENGVLRVRNPAGVVQEYPYYEAPTPPPQRRPASAPPTGPGEGYRYFFREKGWYLAREYFEGAARNLGVLFRLTGDRAYARRAALILNRFAEVYPGYCVHYDMPFIQKIIFSADQKAPYPVEPYRAAKWDWWAYMDIPEGLIRAYDLVRDSGEMDEGMQRRVENDLFRGSVDFVRAIPVMLSNMDPTLLRGLITTGRVLGDPDYIHDVVGRIERLVNRQFFVDGMWREGTVSYHNQTVGGLVRLAGMLKGYSDPTGYVHPGDGRHFQDLDLMGQLPILKKARDIPGILRYPNGRVVAIHDTWAAAGRGSRGTTGTADSTARQARQGRFREADSFMREWRAATGPKDSTSAWLLNGVGHARLGRGRGAQQMEAHLTFSGGYGHQHADMLSLTLFSNGQERLSDIGYTHTRDRFWSICTLSHNTVMVDGRDQEFGSDRKPTDGDLLLYVPGDDSFQAVDVSAERAYPGVTRVYRRTLAMVGVSPEDAYLVDVFRVSGGRRHEYVLAGDADHDGGLETDLNLKPYGRDLLPAGVKVRFPTGEGVAGDARGNNLAYAYVRDVREAVPTGGWTATFTSEADPKAAVRVHGIGEPTTTVYCGTTPSIRRAREDDGKVDAFTMPILVARREGKDLSSVYVSVLEPYSGRPFIRSVERLDLKGGGPGDIGLKVVHAAGTDLLILRERDGGSVRAGAVALNGRIGLIREEAGAVRRMTLVGGTRLSDGALQVKGEGVATGKVVGTVRLARGDAMDGLLVEGAKGLGDWVKGATVVVRDGAGFTHGFEVSGLRRQGGRQVLTLTDDPGFEMDADGLSRQCFFPGRTWKGGNRFEVAGATTRLFGPILGAAGPQPAR